MTPVGTPMHARTDACMFCTEGSGRNGLVRACLYTKTQARSETGVLPRVRGTRAAGWSGTSRSYPAGRSGILRSTVPTPPQEGSVQENNLPCKEVVVQGGWAGNENVGLSPTGNGCITVVTLLHFVHPM